MANKIPVKNVTPNERAVGKIKSTSLFSPDRIFPKAVSGYFGNLRSAAVILFLSGYFIAPWLSWDGRQAILFDLPTRKFYVFGYTFWPQDFFILALISISAAFGLFLITTYAGRIWCGYGCPQTVWTKIFLWVENFAEGSRNQQIKLSNSPWSIDKIKKTTVKHSLWLIISLLTALGFLAYFTPVQQLLLQLKTLNLDSWQWFWLLFFTFATYINAGFMREQVCLHGCPYARFQSIMFDDDTLIVSYDEARGESRGSRKKGADLKQEKLGDCIDCKQCVQVCPTGIDIRNGLQYECIGCAACIDACDQIMDKMEYKKGLISYTTQNQLNQQPSRGIFRPRIMEASALLAILGLTILALLFTRVPLELNVAKDRTSLYQNTAMGYIENNYVLKILNKSQQAEDYRVAISSIDQLIYQGPQTIRVDAGEIRTLPVSLEIDPDKLTTANQMVHFHIVSQQSDRVSSKQATRFIAPLWVEQN